MTKLGLQELSITEFITQYLEEIGKIDEFDRIMHSMWTELQADQIISLDLSRLELEHLDPNFFNHPAFSTIEYLYLQGNGFNQLDSSWFEPIPTLQGLNLPNNQLERIEQDVFAALRNLKWLNLASNRLTEVEGYAFEELSALTSLNLSHNAIEQLDETVFVGLDNLEKLKLYGNKLKIINASDFRLLPNLIELNLESNRIIKVSEDLPAYLPNLEQLYLKHNPAFTLQHSFESRFDIIEILRSKNSTQVSDKAMMELLEFEDDQVISTFNQLIEDPRWDGGIGRVSNYKLSQVTGIPIEMIARKIETLITQKKLNNIVHFDNNDPTAYQKHYWIRPTQPKESTNTGINDPKCLWCNGEITDPFDACPHCGLRCEICKFSIKQTQEFDVCTAESDQACLDIFHRAEFLEWVRIYGACPKCSQEIDLSLYQVSQDYSKKVGALVEQDMELPNTNNHENDFLVPMALSILINLKKISKEVNYTEKVIQQVGREARVHHQEILKGLQPLATEIVLITAFLERLEANTLTEKSFKASIDRISDRFDIFEENIDLIYEAHKKDKTKVEKIKQLTLKGGLKGGEVGVKALVERSGLLGKISNYIKLPTKEGLKSILSRIGKGIRDTAGDPTAWIKLAAVFLI